MPNHVTIAQAVLDKARAVTVPARLEELGSAFGNAGIGISPEGSRVISVAGEESFRRLGQVLRDALPTAMLAAKRVLADNSIDI